MKHISIKFLAAFALITMGFGCTKDFDEVNSNPNAPTSVNSGLLLPQIQRDVMNSVMGETWGIGNIVIQHTAKNQFVNEDRYLWGELNSIWNTVYDNMRDVKIILQQSEANGENNYKAIALIMKSWMFSLATDAYGDIPYSEAISAKEGQNYPKYDTQEAIYNGILADLKTASDLLGTTGEVVAGDVIYKGDLNKWKKLANSLRVRALLRISRKRDVSAELRAIIDSPSNYPVFESNADNALYSYAATAPDQFPLYSSRIGSFNEFRASKTLLDTLKSLSDPRMPIFFRPTPDTENSANPVFAGIPNGLNDVDALQYNGGPQFQSRIGSLYYEQSISTTGLTIAKGIIMTYAELQFLLAEAAEKGLLSGNAKTFYENGVNGSFTFYGLTTPADYLTRTAVAYEGSQQEKLAKIGFQKWISLFFQGMEAWFDWRRTGIPALTPGISNQNNNMIPVRFRYPIIEQALNETSYNEAVQRQGADDLNTKMWYLK
ncbi:MAG TPA: SusD/RagB family nutrient-binding outer membrane lipoprotein [Saprospiraceae bacterium]|nr:SusD/RagB family nutrient-binding outer membrane lipoprotein [Saprospiraceae bacterium]